MLKDPELGQARVLLRGPRAGLWALRWPPAAGRLADTRQQAGVNSVMLSGSHLEKCRTCRMPCRRMGRDSIFRSFKHRHRSFFWQTSS